MTEQPTQKTSNYTCADYRLEMRLLGARQQLNNPSLTDEEKKKLMTEIEQIEKELGF